MATTIPTTTTFSRSLRTLEPRSGGKIVRPRRVAAPRTPYDRPTRFANPPDPQTPNWFSRLASGAGKIISSVLGPDSSSSSSSSDSSSSSSGDGSDNDGDDDDDVISIEEDDGLNKRNGTSGTINFFRKEAPETLGTSSNKHVIEQLLMQETFSREECDRLIKIIKSRVVGFSCAEDAENATPNQGTPDLCGTAVTEAKKWLNKKRLESASKADPEHGTCTLNSLMFPQGAEDEGGSPVDVAKLYMQERPPWASPSIKHGELRSPSSIGMQLFNEETPYSLGGNSVSASKLKRDTLATGSWNIQEEIRKVRSKATEDMLRWVPSPRIDWSGSAIASRSNLDSLPAGKLEDEMGDKPQNFRTSAGANLNLSSGITTYKGFNVLEKTQHGLQKEALPPPATISSEQIQDSQAASVDGKGGSQNALEDMLSTGQRVEASEDIQTAPSDAGAHTTNGFPSSVASLSSKLGIEENTILDGEINIVSSSHENVGIDLIIEETNELLNEAAIEVYNKNENDVHGTTANDGVLLDEATVQVSESIENYIDVTKDNDFAAGGSQNSSSMPDGLSQELMQPNSKRSQAAKTNTVAEKQKGTRLTKYNRRGRPRGK